MKKHILAAIVLSVSGSGLFAQSSEIIQNYIAQYKDIAMSEMQRTGVPASITLAQGIHETGAGTSALVLKSNNHFGIKCKTDWTGGRVYHDDDARGECFRKYDDPIQSYRDHSDFLKYRPYYASLFKLDPLDYKGWAYGLKKAGYATNPKYPQILIKLIEDYNLQDYSLIAMNLKTPDEDDAIWASNKTEVKTETEQEARIVKKDLKLIYPTGIFQINRTRVMLAAKGTSYLKIAAEQGISLKRLFDFNDMTEEEITTEDRLIFLQRKRRVGASEFHTVEPGETTYDIAQYEGIRFEDLLDYNFLKPGMQPAPGEKLYLQGEAPSMPRLYQAPAVKPAVAPPSLVMDSFMIHIVQTGETAYAISRKYGVTVEEIMKWNSLPTADLRTGQELRIKKSK